MKYFLQILLVLVICAGVVTGVYYYTNDNKLPWADKLQQSTTVTKLPATEKYVSKTLLASLDKEDFKLYKGDRTIILEHGGKSYEFDNWSSYISEEKPKMYLIELDGDKDKELVVRGVGGKDEATGEFVYDLYILNPKHNGDGFELAIISQDTWRTILNNYTRSEITQLKKCKKTIQFTMNVADEAIAYNENTGIAENGYSDYARALQDKNGKYLTVGSWLKGKGVFTINKKNHICAEVEVIVNYTDSDQTQNLGNVYFEISLSEQNKFSVTEKTLEFKPSKKYKTAKPLSKKLTPWEYTEQNTAPITQGNEIKYLSYSPKLDASTIMQTVSLGSQADDTKFVKQIYLSENKAVLTAGDGCVFSSKIANSPDFSVVINKGQKDEYDIAYTATLDSTKTVLTINFDRGFNSDEIKTIEINFGA